jgi:hypothetical protein
VVSTTPRPLYPRERPGTHCTEGWLGHRAWTCAKNLAPTGIRSPDSPARSQSLYRLRYPDPSKVPNMRLLTHISIILKLYKCEPLPVQADCCLYSVCSKCANICLELCDQKLSSVKCIVLSIALCYTALEGAVQSVSI